MKKFLSVLLTMAMVMSLFTGTVLAATNTAIADKTITAGTASYELTLNAWVASDAKVSYAIYTARTGVAVPFAYNLADQVKAETNITVGTDDSVTINTSTLTTATPQTTYYVVVTDAAGNTLEGAIKVQYTLTINGSTDAPKVNLNEATTLTGLLTNNGAVVKNTVVSFKDAANNILGLTTTNNEGTFSMTVTVTTAAAYTISVGAIGAEVAYKTVAFNVVDSITVTVDSKPATLRSGANTAGFTFTNKTGTTALTGNLTNHNLVNITTPDGTVLTTTVAAAPYTLTLIDLRTGVVPTLKAGTYTVQIMVYLDDVSGIASQKIADATAKKPYATGTTTFTIVDNTNELYVTASVGGLTSNVPVSATAAAEALSLTAPGTKLIKSVVYTVAGPLKASATQTVTPAAAQATVAVPADAAPKTVTVTGEGVITISGTVTYSDNTTDTFSKTISVKGYNAVYAPAAIGSVGNEVEVSVTVTNEAGAPVNNAIVTWSAHAYNTPLTAVNAFKVWNAALATPAYGAVTNTHSVNGQNTVIQNGVYSAKIKLEAPAEILITVQGNEGGAFLANYVTQRVTGAPVYTVATVPSLLAAKNGQTLNLQMTDANGAIVQPTYAYIEDLNAVVGGNAEYKPAGTAVPYDATKKATAFVLNTAAKAGSFTVFLGTDLGNKMVAVPVSVVAPSVTVKVNGVESNVVTAGRNDKIELTFADKNAAIVVSVPAGNYDKMVQTAAPTLVQPVAGIGVGSVTISTQLVGTNAEGKFVIQATFAGGPAITVATMTVKKPIMDLGGVKELEISNVVDLPLTLTDANGAAIKNQVITPSGAVLVGTTVTTDDNGKATLTLSPNTVGKLTLTATGLVTSNTPADFAVTVPVVRDIKGPVVALEEVYTVNTSSATISFNVTDGSRVTEVWVGFEKAMVRPDGSTVFTVSNLQVGVNEFDVLAYDEYGNSTEATLVVEYLKPATVVLTIGSTDATKDGAAMTGMDQAPTIVNGRTFLPVRFVFVNLLGGTIEWDATTQTITSVVKGNTIKMVVGSKTAFVNGNAVALLEAPYIEAATGRTLVPMREIMEAIGISLTWNATTQTVSIVIPQ